MKGKRIHYLKNKLEVIEFTTTALISIFDTYELIIKKAAENEKAEILKEIKTLENLA